MTDAPAFLDVLFGVLTGLGLAAACGFRVFVPPLAIAVGLRLGWVEVHPDFAWLGSLPALVVLGAATLIEVLAYFLPWVDNALDSLATPLAAIAGFLVAMAAMVDVDPWLRWSLGLIAGAGLATVIQLPTAAARGVSTASTAGLGNFLVSLAELLGSALLSLMALLAPIVVPMVLIALVFASVHRLRRNRRLRQPRAGTP